MIRLPILVPDAGSLADDLTELPTMVRRGRFERGAGCGRLCCERYGHDALTHELAGRDAVYAAIAARRSGRVCTGALVVDFDEDRVTVDGAEPRLSPLERDMLGCLAERLGATWSHYDLIANVWGVATADLWMSGVRSAHTLRVMMARLRRRLGSAGPLVETAIGRGYRLRRVTPTVGMLLSPNKLEVP